MTMGEIGASGSRSKNKEPETLILPPAVVTVLKRQQPDPNCRTCFVFSFDGTRPIGAGGDLKKKIDANMHRRIELAAASGRAMPIVEHFNLHDLRTAGATTLQEKPFLVPPQDACLAGQVKAFQFKEKMTKNMLQTLQHDSPTAPPGNRKESILH